MQYIHLPSGLTVFRNSKTTIEVDQSGREVYLLHGELERDEVSFCPECGQKMHIHGSRITMLRHLCFGSRLSVVRFEKRRYRCPCCGHTEMESVPFKADGHNITHELLQFKSYFDGIFGEGAGIAICTERSDLRLCMDAMNAFFAFSEEQKSEMQSFGSTFSKYSNREQRAITDEVYHGKSVIGLSPDNGDG